MFSGIDALSAADSWAAAEEWVPIPAEVLAAERAQVRVAGNDEAFFILVYNQSHAPAEQWFGARGWVAEPAIRAECLLGWGGRPQSTTPRPGR